MNKNNIKLILECIIIFLIVFIYNRFLYESMDHIIDFTHAYSIASGLKIYKDFNIVIGPIYPVLMSIFLILFGKNLLVFDIVNSLIVVIIYLIIRKNNKETLSVLAISFLIYGLFAKYNMFTLLFFYIIYYLEKKDFKYKNIIIGILLSILLFTKINVGILMIVGTIIINYKNIKELFERGIACIISSSIIILIIYLSGILKEFINYTMLGLVDFNNNISYKFAMILLIPVIIYLIRNIKKDKNLIYMFCYLGISYPIFDYSHISLAIFPTFVYFIDNLKSNDKIRKLSFIISIILFSILVYTNNQNFMNFNLKCKNKYCFNSYGLETSYNYVKEINKNIKNKNKYRLFFFNDIAYLHKLVLNQDINKYDFIWNGNMGYKGTETYIKEINEICKKDKCLFVISKKDFKEFPGKQLSTPLLKYVANSYNEQYSFIVGGVQFTIYTN